MTDKSTIPDYERSASQTVLRIFLDGLAIFAILALMVVGLVLLLTPAGDWLASSLNWLFAADSQQLWWYVTRSAAIIAYLLLWLSTAWGLAVPSRIIQPVLDQTYTFDFHQTISLLSIGFALLHIIVLMLDRYLPYSTLQILIPFLSPSSTLGRDRRHLFLHYSAGYNHFLSADPDWHEHLPRHSHIQPAWILGDYLARSVRRDRCPARFHAIPLQRDGPDRRLLDSLLVGA